MIQSTVIALLALLLVLPCQADSADAAATYPPIAVSAIAPSRQALIVSIGATGVAKADPDRYRELLRLLGFQVTQTAAETRPELKGAFASFARQIKAGADVAVFVLGPVLPKGDDLYLMASDADPSTDRFGTEGLRLSDAMAAVADAGARDTVLFVDACREVQGQSCRIVTGTVPEGVSAIVGKRIKVAAAGAPVAGVTSLAPELLTLLQREGLTDLALFGALEGRLSGTDMGVTSSPSLSRSFSFLPIGFLAGLATPCNAFDPDAGADAVRNAPSVDPTVQSCVKAAATWNFLPWFRNRIAAAREQSTFQHAAAGCDTEATRAYLAVYPQGRFTAEVRKIATTCETEHPRVETPRTAPQTATPMAAATCTIGGLDPAGNNWLALRLAPNYQAAWQSTRLVPGTTVSTYDRADTWTRLRLASGETGWVRSKYLRCR